MTLYAQHVSTRTTPQTEPIPGKPMVANSAGGFSFAVDDWTRLERFVVLGNEGGSYYATERALTKENAACVLRCADLDPRRTVETIAAISEAGRAPKNDPAIFALALLASHKPSAHHALTALPHVCRIPTHLFAFAESVQALRGWGRGLRRAVADWYLDKDARQLAYQCCKYQSRNGWTHRDLLRLSHPKASDPATQTVLHWCVKGWPDVGATPHDNEALLPIWAFERAKRATSAAEIVRLIRDYRLVRECIPTQFLTDPAVWDALLDDMPLTALVRNLATMTRVGLVTPLSDGSQRVCAALEDGERLRKARIHPVALLAAQLTYAAGHGQRGQNTWQPVSQVVDALDRAFYAAFAHVEPTGKRWYLGCDVSGSMWGASIAGVPGLTAGIGAAAMAMVTAATETQHCLAAFDTQMHPFAVSPRQRLADVARLMQGLPWGRTDCALPMLDALQRKIPVDVFVVFTDSDTWAGAIHPVQALRQYRQQMGIPARLIVCGMTANGFTIADPSDAGMLDVVGFDTNVPQVMAQFAVA